MIDVKSTFSQLLYTTIRITANLRNGSQSFGTGFFFHYVVDELNTLPVIITNKHVVDGADSITFFLHYADEKYQPTDRSFPITLQGESNRWYYHPNKDIDLCALPCGPLFHLAEFGHNVYRKAVDESLILTDQMLEKLLPVEEILMLGSPLSLWDNLNNFPLFRKGITASHPALDFNQRSIGVVDIAVFPGSSGSPLFIANAGSYLTGEGINIGERLYLLGVVFQVFTYAVNGEIVAVNVPTAQTFAAQSMVPAHLGLYVKAKEILALKDTVLEGIGAKKSLKQ